MEVYPLDCMTQNKLSHVVALEPNAELGEGLHWDTSRNLLWFVDILNNKLFSFCPSKNKQRSFNFAEFVSWVIAASNNNLLLGVKDKILRFNPDTLKSEILFENIFQTKGIRFNDAKVSAQGNILAGSMNYLDNHLGVGALYLISENSIETIDKSYNIPNGPVVINETDILHTDSYKREIYKLKLDNLGRKVIKKELWKSFDKNHGNPDGMCMDFENNIWIAFWGEGVVRKFDLDGHCLNSVSLPEKFVTNVCFGGRNLEKLYVSSAKNSESKFVGFGCIYEVLGHNTMGKPLSNPNF